MSVHFNHPFDFQTEYILEDTIVQLRPLHENDSDKLFYFAENEPALWKYSIIGADGKENMQNYIDVALKGRLNKTEYPFIVIDKRSNTVAGSTRFYDIQLQNQSLQLGYTWYGKKFQGTGLNKHCKFLLLKFAFEEMGIKRVEFRANAQNERSINAMKSIGCTVEGILRNSVMEHNGNRRSSIILSILEDEWFSSGKESLLSKLLVK
jgi:RimJ/RimL family protein N-acetyltransferase